MSYKCDIVADSTNTFGNRITTFLLTFPRFILAEFNTHRVFTRNSSSSIAIPFKKNRRSLLANPFIPLDWMRDHSGMQGSVYFKSKFIRWLLRTLWLTAMYFAVGFASILNKIGLSKQICNRIIEPWMWHTALITATEFENFFALRAHKDAEIHIQKIAFMMLELYNTSEPKQLLEAEWHIPFMDKINKPELISVLGIEDADIDTYNQYLTAILKISTAMCARTSYTTVGKPGDSIDYMNNFISDMKLHDRLAESGHFSPFEHCAKPMNEIEYLAWTRTELLPITLKPEEVAEWVNGRRGRGLRQYHYQGQIYFIGIEQGWCANFCGFIQYRKLMPNENRNDDRVRKTKSISL